MSTFIDLDSIQRDREVYPNPFDYEVTANQIKDWFRGARSVRPFPQNPNTQPREFATTVNIRHLIFPYSALLADFPVVYIDFHSATYKDIHLIQTINGIHADSRFICSFDKIQNDQFGAPLWIHYKCNMEQTLRFKRDDPVVFRVTTRSESILPNPDTVVPDAPDPFKQTLCTFEITPYIRDGDYSESLQETLPG